MPRTQTIGAVVILLALAVIADAAPLSQVRELLRPTGVFERNEGQYEAQTAFVGRFQGFSAAVMTDGGIVLSPDGAPAAKVRVSPIGASEGTRIKGLKEVEYKTHYFGSRGPPITDVPHFGRVSVGVVSPGVDLVYYANDAGKLEFDFVVEKAAHADAIRLDVEGASSILVDENGDLIIETTAGVLLQRKPVAFQVIEGVRVPVTCRYKVVDARTISFHVAGHDPTRELVIDPVVEFATYIGGASYDLLRGVKIGPGGFIYVVGGTASSNFPIVAPYDGSYGGNYDAFITKINPATGKAVYSTFLGDRNGDGANAIDVDSQGQVYVVGWAGDRFPTTAGAYRTSYVNPSGFVTKFNAAGNGLVYSTFLPGTNPAGIAVDSQGRAVIAGIAGTAFSTTPGAFQSTPSPGSGTSDGNAFVMRLNTAGSAADFATFYTGTGGANAVGVALDASGNIFIAGSSASMNLPMASDAMKSSGDATWGDGFVAVFSPAGSALVASTYLGGSGGEEIVGLAVDRSGDIVVVGRTQSADFPLVNALMGYADLVPMAGFFRKVFVTKLARNPMRILFSTFVGSKVACCDWGGDVAIDSAGEIYATSETAVGNLAHFESKHGFVTRAYAQSMQGTSGSIAILTAIRRDGGMLLYNTLAANSIANPEKTFATARSPGEVAIAGRTDATWLPIAPANFQAAITDTFYGDGFVMSFTTDVPALAFDTSVAEAPAATSIKMTASTFAPTTEQTVTFWDGAIALGTAPLAGGIATLSASFPPGIRRLKATLGSLQSSETILPVYVPSGACQ